MNIEDIFIGQERGKAWKNNNKTLATNACQSLIAELERDSNCRHLTLYVHQLREIRMMGRGGGGTGVGSYSWGTVYSMNRNVYSRNPHKAATPP